MLSKLETDSEVSDRKTANAVLLDDGLGYLLVRRLESGTEGTVNIVRSVADGQFYVHQTLRLKATGPGTPEGYELGQIDKPTEFEFMEILGPTGVFPRLYNTTMRGTENPSNVMEYCNGGDVGAILKHFHRLKEPLPEVFIWRVMASLCQALAFMHNGRLQSKDPPLNGWSGSIEHGDLHKGNVFLHWINDNSVPRILLGDLGRSRIIPPDQCRMEIRRLGGFFRQLVGGHDYSRDLEDWLDKFDAIKNPNGPPSLMTLLTDFVPQADMRIHDLGTAGFDQNPRPQAPTNRPTVFETRGKSMESKDSEEYRVIHDMDLYHVPYQWVIIDDETYDIIDTNAGSEHSLSGGSCPGKS